MVSYFVNAAAFCLVVGASAAAELYREEFNGTGNNRPASDVGWRVWRRNAVSGLVEDATADQAGTRATLGRVPAYPEHLYNGHNTAEHPVMAWTGELALRRADMTVGEFLWNTYNLNTVPTTQLAVRIGGQWFLHSQTFANDPDDIGFFRVNRVAMGSGSWSALTFAIGAAPAVGGVVGLPEGDIEAFGLYLMGEPDNTQTTGQTQHRIDAMWVTGSLLAAPPNMMTNITQTVTAQSRVVTVRATNAVTQVILRGTTDFVTWNNIATNVPAADKGVVLQDTQPLPGAPFKAYRVFVP